MIVENTDRNLFGSAQLPQGYFGSHNIRVIIFPPTNQLTRHTGRVAMQAGAFLLAEDAQIDDDIFHFFTGPSSQNKLQTL